MNSSVEKIYNELSADMLYAFNILIRLSQTNMR